MKQAIQVPTDTQQVSDFQRHPTNYQPNLFTESRHEFTELEKKIVVLVVNQIGHMAVKGEIKPGANVKLVVPYSELTKKHYDEVSNAADSLQLKRLMYRNDRTEKFDFITPFPRVRSEIIDGKKVIELTMFADVVPHFAELGQRYTKYDIDVMLSLGSVYAQRFYEIVSMFYNRGQIKFSYTVDRLREMINYPEDHTFNDFKKNALWRAQKELSEKANINLEWVPTKKEGKRIVELEFTIKTARQLAADGVEQDRQALRQLSLHEAVQLAYPLFANYKLSPWQKDLIISEFELLDTFYRIHSELTNGLRPGVKNPSAYLIKSLGIDQVKKPKSKGVSDTPLFPDAISRSGSLQSIGSIFENMAQK